MHERSRKLFAELQGMFGKKNEENEVLQQELHSATQMLFELCVKTLGYVHRHQERILLGENVAGCKDNVERRGWRKQLMFTK